MDFALRYHARDQHGLLEDLKLLKDSTNANFSTILEAGQTLVVGDTTALLAEIKRLFDN